MTMNTLSPEEREEAFDEWIRALDEDVIQGDYGYEDGEFTVYPEHWRSMFNEGLTPADAFKRALAAHSAAISPSKSEADSNG